MFSKKINKYICGHNFEVFVLYSLFFILVYLCFESYFVNILSFSSFSFLFAKYLSELIVYTLVFIRLPVIVESLEQSKTLLILTLAVLSAITISVVLSESGALYNALSARLFLRYFCVFLLALTLTWNQTRLKSLFATILTLGFFQVILAQFQKFGTSFFTNSFPEFNRFFSGAFGGRFVKDIRVLKEGAYTGSFDDPTSLSAFLLLVLIIYSVYVLSTSKHPAWYWLLGMLLSYGLFLTHKRAPLLIGVSISCVILFILLKKARPYLVIVLALAVTIVAVNFTEGEVGYKSKLSREVNIPYSLMIEQVISSQYWEKSASASRLSTLVNVGREYFLFGPFFGYGPDEAQTKRALAIQNPELNYVLKYDGFKDFYWVSLLCFYGYPGFVSILLVFLFLLIVFLRNLKGLAAPESSALLAAIFIILATLVYACVVRAFELRMYSYLFWLMNGVALSVCMRRNLDSE